MPHPRARKKVLFFAEAATLAHVARPLALAKGLDPARFEVAVAAAPAWRERIAAQGLAVHAMQAVDGAAFLARLEQGAALYSEAELEAFVADDRRLLEAVRPDFVVGDFRLSLAVSARLAKVPYAALTNAYWSPYASARMPVPEVPLTRVLGVGLAQVVFELIRPVVFARHARPLTRVRRRHGLQGYGGDLRRAYTDADYTLYADLPGFVPLGELPASHRFLGPVLWSYPAPLPAWWAELPAERPVVYVTLGSSGDARLLETVLHALEVLAVTVVATSAGRVQVARVPANCRLVDFLPGDAASARASLVITNGGSLATAQALALGVPVLGLASNLDQLLNMAQVERLGAGRTLRASAVTAAAVAAAARALLEGAEARAAARGLAEAIGRHEPARVLAELIEGA